MLKFRYLNKNEINSLPRRPGVYAFKTGRDLLYIGKATNIRQRVKNHFQQPGFRDNLFILEAEKIGYIKTESEIDALLLEAGLIKKHQPKFNVLWKDDKNYFYVVITRENFPRISLTHQSSDIRCQRIGPFVDGRALKQTLRVLRKIFPYRTCRTLPKKKCLFYDLKLCPAPCKNKSVLNLSDRTNLKHKEYQKNINNLMKVLRGGKQQVLATLKKEMKNMSKIQEFERAARLKNQAFALENVFQNAHIIKELPEKQQNWSETEKKLKNLLGLKRKIKRIEGYDVSNIQGKLATGAMVVFEQGVPARKEYRKFKIKGKFTPYRTSEASSGSGPNDIAMLKEVLSRRLKHPEWPFPQVMLIDGGKAQLNAANLTIKQFNNLTIKVISLAKRKNELFLENKKKPLLLKTLPQEVSNLILHLRDEAHRFAIAYHKKLRKKALIK